MKVSVAICTYNGSAFLRDQLESIAAQTRAPDELVVCDDHSTDSSVEIARDFASTVSFAVHVSVNSENLGSTRNFEQAIRLCEGDIIALADQDDMWLPEKLKQLENAFILSPKLGLVFSDAELVDDQLHPTGRRLWQMLEFGVEEQQLIRKGEALEVLLPGWFVTGATAAFSAKFRELFLPIPLNLPLIHDGWIGAVISAVAEVRIIPEPLILYRQHAQQQVGAPATLPAHDESVSASLKRINPYDDQLAITESLLERLMSQSAFPVTADVLSFLHDRIIHLKARAKLPQSKFPRVPPVIRELMAGRYHRYSKGLRSAVKDLVN